MKAIVLVYYQCQPIVEIQTENKNELEQYDFRFCFFLVLCYRNLINFIY